LIHDILIEAGIKSFTVIPAIGVFETVKERSLIIKVIVYKEIDDKMAAACMEIKLANEQEQVMMTQHYVDIEVF